MKDKSILEVKTAGSLTNTYKTGIQGLTYITKESLGF